MMVVALGNKGCMRKRNGGRGVEACRHGTHEGSAERKRREKMASIRILTWRNGEM
jgi:hypothetical protein